VERIIGIQHRVKKTAKGEAHPTRVCILDNGQVQLFELATESEELDFVLGRLPVSYRDAEAGDALDAVAEHHRQWRKVREGEASDGTALFITSEHGGVRRLQIPDVREGLKPGDKVAMVLGGSGDAFAYALSNRGAAIGATVHRLPPRNLALCRGDNSKEKDAELLARYLESGGVGYHLVRSRDRDVIRLSICFHERMLALKDLMAAQQRQHGRAIGQIFLSEEGQYPEGALLDAVTTLRTSDDLLGALTVAHEEQLARLVDAAQSMPLYAAVFADIKGIGPRIAAGIIAATVDIRRFPSVHAFKAFCGVHVLSGGKYGDVPTDQQFPRNKRGVAGNWQRDARQALYLAAADQFVKRPNTEWGQRLIANKEKCRAKHPVVMCKQCAAEFGSTCAKLKHTRRYTDGHIHRMACWRTATQLAVYIYRAWRRFERAQEAITDVSQAA